MSEQVVVNDFSHLGIRSCDIDGTLYVSVLDFIVFATGCVKGTKIWSELKNEFTGEFRYFTFTGQGAKASPVAEASTLIKIIFKLKGGRAQEFREQHLRSLLAIEDTFLLSDAVRNRLTEFAEYLRDLPSVSDSESDNGGVITRGRRCSDDNLVARASRGPRAYGETSVYVRVRLPNEHTTAVANDKEITMDVMKFGVAYDKQGRHSGYSQDNGYFAFAFTLRSRNEADFVENYIKSTFGTLAVLNSREYLDARRLASELGLEYDGVDYDAYLVVARTLFVKMVEFAKLVYPGAYDGIYGTLYKVVETVNDLATADDTSLSFAADNITRDLAAQFGFRNPETTWQPVIVDLETKST